MNIINRGSISMKRNWKQTMIVFILLVFLLTLIAGAISVKMAIQNTDLALRAHLLPVITIRLDQLALLDESLTAEQLATREPITPEILETLGELPYVRMFNYTLVDSDFFSNQLVSVFDPELFNPELFIQLTPEIISVDDFNSWGQHQNLDEHTSGNFTLRGVHNPHMIDIESGLIKLINGRAFAEDDMTLYREVAMVSQAFLSANNLSVGDVMPLEYRLDLELSEDAEPLVISSMLELEIIGTFDHVLPEELSLNDLDRHIEILNWIYVPNTVIKQTFDFVFDAMAEIAPSVLEELFTYESYYEIVRLENILFLLDDPLNLESFREEALDILPPFWTTSDLSNAYADFSSSMAMMNELANGILIGTVVAVVFIFGLVLLLFLRNRKQEFGIYRALGASRQNVMFQVVGEVLVISVLAITLALFIGNYTSSFISEQMITNDLIRQAENEDVTVSFGDTVEGMGFSLELTQAEMIDLYQISIDIPLILSFYGVSILVISTATIIPLAITLKFKPKVLLTGFS